MIIIDQNVERTLIQDVLHAQTDPHIHRCLFLNLSTISQQDENIVSKYLQSIELFFEGENSRIYVCKNHDLFIFTGQVPRKQVVKFLSHIFPTVSSDSRSPNRDPATIFETGINWDELVNMCAAKVRILEQKEQKQAAQIAQAQETKKRQKVLNMKPDDNDVAMLVQRRIKREGVHIMIIEDDPFTQKMVQKILPEAYSVSVAKDGYEAFLHYARKAPDLVFLDIGLPDVTGHDILNKILQVDPNAFIVMLSGNGDQENVLKAVKAGAKGFIGKPFTKDKVEQYLQKSPHIQNKE